MRGEKKRWRRTSETGRGQKEEDEYEFRDGKGEQKNRRKIEWFCHSTPVLVVKVREFCREESPPWTKLRFYTKDVGKGGRL